MSPIQFFAVNGVLTILLAFAVLLTLVVIIAMWTGVRIGLFARAQKKADQNMKGRRITPDGRAVPPRGSGICELCHGVCPDVYFLLDGRRLCDMCYDPNDAIQAADIRRSGGKGPTRMR